MTKPPTRKIDEALFGRLQNQTARLLEKECAGCESLLDVGCGADSPIKSFSRRIARTVGVDGYASSIDRSRAAGIHKEYRLMNVLDLDDVFPSRSFDCVIACQVIEHLEKKDGMRLLAMMETIARHKVIVSTPNGFLHQREYDGNDTQVHRSGWDVDEMRALGFRVTGVNGWKALRGERADARWWPKAFWTRVSLISQLVTTGNPRNAFVILCVREIS